jgi:uncharacterized membrane protein YuzA (DUF378 family)
VGAAASAAAHKKDKEHFTMMRKLSLIALAIVALGALTMDISGAVTNRHKAVSKLFGSATVRARAKYESCMVNGASCRKFQVVVNHAPPNRTLAVRLNNHKVGVVRTNSSGRGKLHLRTAAFIGGSDACAMSHNFPNVHCGSRIKVGSSVCGVFFDDDEDDAQEYQVDGELENGEVSYTEEMDDDVLVRTFEVEAEGFAPGESVDIAVNGNVVATVVADEDGEIELEMRSAASGGDDDDEGDEIQAMPDSFPTLQPGDVVTVGAQSTTLSLNVDDDDDQGEDHDGNGGDDDDDDDDDGGGDDD